METKNDLREILTEKIRKQKRQKKNSKIGTNIVNFSLILLGCVAIVATLSIFLPQIKTEFLFFVYIGIFITAFISLTISKNVIQKKYKDYIPSNEELEKQCKEMDEDIESNILRQQQKITEFGGKIEELKTDIQKKEKKQEEIQNFLNELEKNQT